MPTTIEEPLSGRPMQLPPPYSLVTLREGGDAFGHACSVAGSAGAGTLVWVRRFDLVELAVVLEPEEPLGRARRAFFAGANALVDALVPRAPPELPVSFDWPDAVRIDGVLVGGSRLGWPEGCLEEDVPPWLVFSAMIRSASVKGRDTGSRRLCGALDDFGFSGVDAGEVVASFASHLMHGFHEWREDGFDGVARRWLRRLSLAGAASAKLTQDGDLVLVPAAGTRPVEQRSLREALSPPTWLDPDSGEPWL